MIDAFIKLMEDDSENIDIKELFKNKKELIVWEKWFTYLKPSR